MSEFSRRNLACASHHKVPDGWQSWSGMMRGYSKRPFCWDVVGHAGPHWAQIENPDDRKQPSQRMEWPNKIGIPSWLAETTIHGLEMLAAHGGPDARDAIRALNNGDY